MHRTQNAAVGLLTLCLHSIVKASPHCGPTPTPTFSGLRDSNQVEFDISPTAKPWSPSELLKRLSGKPAICGWVDGDGSELAGPREVKSDLTGHRQYCFVQLWLYLMPQRQHTSAAVRRVDWAVKPTSPLATTPLVRPAMRHALLIVPHCYGKHFSPQMWDCC